MTLSAQGVALVAWVGASVAQVEALRADLMCIPGPQVLALLVQVGALAAGPVMLWCSWWPTLMPRRKSKGLVKNQVSGAQL